MTTPSWPSTVAFTPIEGSFAETRQDSVVRFATEAGPGKQRRRSTATAVATELTILLRDSDEYDDFVSFYEDDLASGTLRFTADHPVTAASKTWRFASEPELSARQFDWLARLSLTRLD